MNLTTILNLLVVPVILQFGCSVSTSLETRPDASTQPLTSSQSPVPSPTVVLTPVKLESFIGCWSSGTGKIIRITDKQIFSSTNDFKPVNFVVEESGPDVLVLRLTNRPQFYYFQDIISLEIDKNEDPKTGFPLTILDYINREDFDNQSSVGHSGWVKSDCKEWFKH